MKDITSKKSLWWHQTLSSFLLSVWIHCACVGPEPDSQRKKLGNKNTKRILLGVGRKLSPRIVKDKVDVDAELEIGRSRHSIDSASNLSSGDATGKK